MYYSKLFGKTVKIPPSGAPTISHKLLVQSGYIRESTAGRFYFLPLGQRVQLKIIDLIRESMNEAGAQEMLTPVLHPFALWQETNRDTSTGYELTTIEDRRGSKFALGGTAEEMFVDLVRKFQLSYRDLPFNLYQFSSKFRDELRARGGLLRVREFIMKDAYSFHENETDFKREYEQMKKTYAHIFSSLGLQTIVVESDNGYIGGEYCHEFVVESAVGESKFLVTDDGTYAAHEDVAVFYKENKNVDEPLQDLKEVEAVRGTTMEDGVTLHNMPLWQQIKDVLFVDEKGRFILAILRGDYDVNEVKLARLMGSVSLRHATEKEIREVIHSEPGFISPVGIKDSLGERVELIIVADDSLRGIHNTYGGANKKNRDLLNMNIDRDYTADMEGDIALAKDGYVAVDTVRTLTQKRGIEVGNIFQLGFHYTNLMKSSVYTDAKGETKPFYMGCYGIGIGRTLAAIVEKHHDERGIVWPRTVTPYHVHLVGLDGEDASMAELAVTTYKKLTENRIEVLYDDRDVRAGEKFGDADLIGIPIRLIVSKKNGTNIEFKLRDAKESSTLTMDEVLDRVKEFYNLK